MINDQIGARVVIEFNKSEIQQLIDFLKIHYEEMMK